jgi:hypothetical protein
MQMPTFGRYRGLGSFQQILKQRLLVKIVDEFESGDMMLRLYDPPAPAPARFRFRG